MCTFVFINIKFIAKKIKEISLFLYPNNNKYRNVVRVRNVKHTIWYGIYNKMRCKGFGPDEK